MSKRYLELRSLIIRGIGAVARRDDGRDNHWRVAPWINEGGVSQSSYELGSVQCNLGCKCGTVGSRGHGTQLLL